MFDYCSHPLMWAHTHLVSRASRSWNGWRARLTHTLQIYSLYTHTVQVNGHFTQTQGGTCKNALAVCTKHGLSACISKQVMVGKVPREKQENGVPEFLGCDVVYSTFWNSR